jgi:hypothetical protein
MLFYIYMQPEVIVDAQAKGPFAIQVIISFLRAAIQNCCLAEFEDYRTQQSIAEYLEQLPEDFDRKILKSLFVTLQKRNRFIYILKPDYSGGIDDISTVLTAADSVPLDLLLLLDPQPKNVILKYGEVCLLSTYQHTAFEVERSRLANEGRTLSTGEKQENDFLQLSFGKLLKLVNRIEICDRIFGQQFGDNFEYTAKILFRWLDPILGDPPKCKVVFHIGVPQKATLAHIQAQLSSFRVGRLRGMPIELHIYDVPFPDQCLPHERFIVTDQIAIEIGRGMDFLDRSTHRNRDVSIGYKSIKEVNDLITSYQVYRQQTVRF